MDKNICPHCGAIRLNELILLCNTCKKILPLNKDLSYFQLFNINTDYLIDILELDNRLLELQTLFHPDKYIVATPLEKQISIENSSIVNNAYKTLKNPINRATYLFELQGIYSKATDIPQELLLESLEWREHLESSNSQEDIDALLGQVLQMEEKNYIMLQDTFAKKLYNEALLVYIKLKFIHRFKQEIIDKIESLDETF